MAYSLNRPPPHRHTGDPACDKRRPYALNRRMVSSINS